MWANDGTSSGTSEIEVLASAGSYTDEWTHLAGEPNGTAVLEVDGYSENGASSRSVWLTDGPPQARRK